MRHQIVGWGIGIAVGMLRFNIRGIENGELTFPVEEVTVAGNLRDMLHNVVEIGNDLEFRGSVACPTIRIDGMTVAGE